MMASAKSVGFGSVMLASLPWYMSVGIPALTELLSGQLKSTITLFCCEFFLSLTSIGLV